MKHISVVERAEGEWRWVFTDTDAGTELESNNFYDSFYSASRAASVAYPGIPIAAAKESALPRGLSQMATRRAGTSKKGLPEKIGSILAPIVVLLAWRRAKK
ncbi:MAG: hypothetical protein ABR579_06645 [Actinomycetota bacterium]